MSQVSKLRQLRAAYDVGSEGYNALTEAIAEVSKAITIIESPFKTKGEERGRNIRYVRACLQDSLKKGEAPFASHALYTLPGVLNDRITKERELGMEAGFAFQAVADQVVVYTDLGVSDGMKKGIEKAVSEFDLQVKERTLKPTAMDAVLHG